MDNSQCIRLISLYRENKCLWDPNDTNYTNRGVREDAWRKISQQMNNIPITELKKKMKSLSGGYRRERFREKQSRITGSGAEDTYKSKWFAYDEFAFMADKNDPGTTRDTLQQEESNSTTGSGEHTINENALENVPPESSEETAAQSNVQNTQQNVQTQKKNQNKRRKKTCSHGSEDIMITDESISEAFQLLHQCSQPQQPETDSYTAFGQYIATELRKYDHITLTYVKHAISQIIFEADTGRYRSENYGYYTSTSSYTERPSESTITQLPSTSLHTEQPSDLTMTPLPSTSSSSSTWQPSPSPQSPPI